MSGKDPFAEGPEPERTVIRPNPGGRRLAPAPPAAPGGGAGPAWGAPPPAPLAGPIPGPAPGPGPSAGGAAPAEGLTGNNPLTAAASVLFSLVSRMRNRAQHPDPEALRRAVVAEVRAFEARALQAGADPQQLKVARYAICATLDDVVLNTPWGEASGWAMQTMVGTFHRENVGGDRFYDLLARLEQDPGRNIELLEFLHLCLALGFEGRLRIDQGGADRHQEIRAGLAGIIRRQRGQPEPGLAPNWRGVVKPHKALSLWKPFWLAVIAGGFVLAGGFLGLSWALSTRTEGVLASVAALDPVEPPRLERRAPPVIPEPVPEVVEERATFASFLEPEIREGLVSVLEDGVNTTIRLAGAGMFGSGSDALKPEMKPMIERVALALKEQAPDARILVAGHSDSQPIRSARFPSNMHLSLARAESVRAELARQLGSTDRLSAEGRADKEPIADNATREGRAANRRIELILIREGG